jgi:hypothetical protein
MKSHISIWKANLNSGLILGFIAAIYTLIIYFFDVIFSPYQGYVFYLIQAVFLFILIKAYRENYRYGVITYGQAVSSGVIISLYTAIIYSAFIYILYAFIDTGLVNKQLAFIEDTFVKSGVPQKFIDSGLEMQKKFLQPAIYASTRLVSNFIGGIILTLIIAIFIKKESNPLTEISVLKD